MTCRKFHTLTSHGSAAAAKSLQSCLTLCDPIDGSPPGSPGSLMAFIYKVIMANTVLYLLLQFLLMSASKSNIFTCGCFCPTHTELYTLIQVCALAKCKAASIYADSRHAFRLANDFRILCKQCNSLTSSGNRI